MPVLAVLYFKLSTDDPHSDLRSMVVDDVSVEYDYVIVGGGSAGSVLASRLSESKNTVLLLEAGGFYDENPMFDIPIQWSQLQQTPHDWRYVTEPQVVSCQGLKGQRSFWPRGRVLGGSSVINVMQYTRGSRYEFDEWAAKGCAGWSYRDVLPYFLKSENVDIDDLKSSKYHNSGGPLTVSTSKVTAIADLYNKAGLELGYKHVDYNGRDQEGFSNIQLTVRDGTRDHVALAYLGRIGKRPNLHIHLNAFVTKLDIEDRTAQGVFFIKNGRKNNVRARKEVIVSGGAISSPQLLMLSGIGPREHLKELGVDLVVDLPVGYNLQDHQMLFLYNKVNSDITITTKRVESFWSQLQYRFFGSGPLSGPGVESVGFFYADDSKRGKTSAAIQVDIFSYLVDISKAKLFNYDEVVAREYMPGNNEENGISFLVSVTHPKSRGTIRLRSKDPFDHPKIDPQYLTDERDIQEFIAGIRIWEKFVNTSVMKQLGANTDNMNLSFCSHRETYSDAYWKCVVRHLAVTMYHHCCTCKMGAADDKRSVLDTGMKVKGVKGLRVVDASSLPDVTSGNINAPVIMLAEKTADLILGIDSVRNLREKLPENI